MYHPGSRFRVHGILIICTKVKLKYDVNCKSLTLEGQKERGADKVFLFTYLWRETANSLTIDHW